MNGRLAIAAVVLAGVLWGVISVFVRQMSAAGMTLLQIVMARALVSLVVFLPVLACVDRTKLRIRPRDAWMFAGTGIVSLVLFNFCYFYTIAHGQAAVGAVLLYTSPIFILLLSAILFRERITRWKLFCLVLTVLGCALVTGVCGGVHGVTWDVVLLGLASGLLYGLYTIFGRFALKRYDAQTVTLWTFAFCVLGSAPFADLPTLVRIVAQTPSVLLWTAGIGIVSTLLPYLLYTWGLQRMENGKAAIIVAVEPLVAALLGMFFYGESYEAVKIFGMAAILSAIVFLNFRINSVQSSAR